MIVIVLGTGRCGTTSVSHLLNMQNNATCTHERCLLPWKMKKKKVKVALKLIQKQKTLIKGDAAFYYLPYCDYIASVVEDVRFVCLKRNKQEVVKSFVVRNKDLFRDAKKKWDRCMPTYGKISIAKATSRHYDEYYECAEKLTKKLSFKIFDMNNLLNTEDGQKQLFEFLQIVDPKIKIGLRLNKRQKR